MTRRTSMVLVAAVVLGLGVLATPASAQQGSPPAVAGIEIERSAPAAPAVPDAPAAPAPAVKGVSLARSGSEAIQMALVAGVLLGVGTVLVVGARRRQVAASPASAG